MAIVINGSGTVTGISVGGLPDGIVDAGTLATNSVDSAELIDGSIDNSHIDAMAASKLTGALPAISAASLTAIPAANITGTLPAIDGSNLTGVGGGKVLQVIHSRTNTKVSTSSSTPSDIGLDTSITPSSTTSKILIMLDITGYGVSPSAWHSRGLNFWLMGLGVGGSLHMGEQAGYITDSTAGSSSVDSVLGSFSFSYLESPNTTSALTYQPRYSSANGGTAYCQQHSNNWSTITLMEIGA